MREFIRVYNLLNELYPDLEVCSDSGNPTKILQWQCHGEVSADEFGITLESELFSNKARSFISLANSLNPDLLLTPEYSFPYSILQEIIDNSELWPNNGKLWCLGTQGDKLENFINKLETWRTKENVVIVDNSICTAHQNNFISPLIYLFRLTDERLCIIPQLKTGQMTDIHNTFEGPNLSCGDTIFVFNNGKEGSYQNAFLSIICSDILHLQVHELVDSITECSILLFHPQLNSNPRYDEFRSFKRTLLTNGQRDARIITLNWADETRVEGTDIRFIKPWSALYKNSAKKLNDKSFLKHIKKNHKRGTAFTMDNHIEVWYSHRFEHCKYYLISKGYNGSSHHACTNRDEPDTLGCYMFENNEWVSKLNICSSNIAELFSKNHMNNEFPYPVCKGNQPCDSCIKSDFFFGSVFGHFDSGELESKNEVTERFLVGSDKESDEKRNERLDMIIHLKEQLDSGNLPEALSYLKENYKFEISEEFLDNRKDLYNIVPIRYGFNNPEVLAVICKHTIDSDIEELHKQLSDQFSKKYRNQILIYYKVPGGGYRWYDKQLVKSSILKKDFLDDEASITNSNSSFLK